MKKIEVTEKEKELIETLRNYRKAYPNGSKMMEMEIDELVATLMSKE